MSKDETETGSVPLSVLFDRMAGDLPGEDSDADRDQHFVRAFTEWLQSKAQHLTFDLPTHYTLEDVVATFHMRDRVKLVVTGYPPSPFVGSVTLEVDEQDFPRVIVTIHAEPQPAPYDFCTLDYFAAGTRVTIHDGSYAGLAGTVLVAATLGLRRQLRVKLDAGPGVTVDADHATLQTPTEGE